MKNFSESRNPNTELCDALKKILEVTHQSIRQNMHVDTNQTIRRIVDQEYMKHCIVKEVKSMPILEIQQWYDSK